MNLLSRDAILNAQDLATKDVEVKAWGGTIRLRMLTAAERAVLESQQMDSAAKWSDFKVRVISMAAIDEEGNNLFTEDDLNAIKAKSGSVIDLLFLEANNLNKLSTLDTDEAEKESADAQADGSTSNSPGDSDTHTLT
jgi:hypothetical protein